MGEAADELQALPADLLPAVVDPQRVVAVGQFDVLGDAGVADQPIRPRTRTAG